MSTAALNHFRPLTLVCSLAMAGILLVSCVDEPALEEESGSGSSDSTSETMDTGETTMGSMDEASQMSEGGGLVTVQSEYGFDETLDRVTQNVEGGGNMIVATVDHSAAAAEIGEELPPTTLVIFGNPEGGTPFMQSSQSAGIDLPQKMLVWEDEAGDVYISYNEPQYIAQRHGLTGVEEQIDTATEGLQSIAEESAGGSVTGGEATLEETMMEETTQ